MPIPNVSLDISKYSNVFVGMSQGSLKMVNDPLPVQKGSCITVNDL
uniref:Uncharacterized protein n=1 Tax=Setaria italica TaxID=4555 RepID=K3ZFM0_SETIT